MQSEQIGELAAALAKAQAEIKAPKKGRTAKVPTKAGGSYSYNYADLADVIECYRPALTKHGLALTQPIRIQDGHMVLVTKLLHASGQWIASEYPLQNYDRPQEQGSAITYARRYAATSLLGIAAEDDDDGARAQDAEPRRREERRPEPEAEPDRPLEGDDAAIVFVAAELAQIRGALDPADVIEEYSKFKGRDGKTQSFREPSRVRSEKWKKGVRQRMEADLHKAQAIREPGVDEAVDLFDGTVI
jgi:hypothetical protein